MMADRFRVIITNDRSRALIARAAEKAPLGFVCEIREENRTDEQNRLLWPLLTDIAAQREWAGRRLPLGDWKNLFVVGLRSESSEYVPTLNFQSVLPLGLSTSAMGKQEFSELIEFIYAWGAEQLVSFRTDQT